MVEVALVVFSLPGEEMAPEQTQPNVDTQQQQQQQYFDVLVGIINSLFQNLSIGCCGWYVPRLIALCFSFVFFREISLKCNL